MNSAPKSASRLVIVDDDLLTREVLSLLAAEGGFTVETYGSGEEVLEALKGAPAPDVILADMQMAGVSGDSLARLLRSVCPRTTLFAMSGTTVTAEHTSGFDGFLLKPFSLDDLRAAIGRNPAAAVTTDTAGILKQSVFRAFSRSMTLEQLRQLYAMSLDDADARVATLRQAQAANDAAAYRRAAHAIKGGCGMIGALQLARIAGQMEEEGPALRKKGSRSIDHSDPCAEFLAASAHLRRILGSQLESIAADKLTETEIA